MRLFRTMKSDKDGLPQVGRAAVMLGVRLASLDGPGDIPVSSDGMVSPETGGMSVTADEPMKLPMHRRPARWGGRSNLPLFVIEADALPPTLVARLDDPDARHYLVEPAERTSLVHYEHELGATRSEWTQT
jgi:hypothetical protein